MSTSIEPTFRPNGLIGSPVEYVRALPPEDKQAVLLALLREAIQLSGDRGLLPVEDEAGESFGYYVPGTAARELFERYGPELTEADRDRTNRALADLSRTFDVNQYLDELRREDGGRG